MTKRLNVPPTRSTLLRLKRQAVFLERGHDMLERKRELLTHVVYQRLDRYRQLREQVRTQLETTYRWLAITEMRMGREGLRRVSLGLAPAVAVRLLPRSTVGVEYPTVTAEARPLEAVSLMATDAGFDAARQELVKAALLLAEMSEAETALWRLLEEQRKTQKRVNALKYNIIPRYRETIHHIQSAIEEEERNALFQVKVLRRRQAV